MTTAKSMGFKRRGITALLGAALSVLPTISGSYSPGTMEKPSTHPLLVRKSVELYETLSGSQPFTAEEKKSIEQGAIEEDSPDWRSLNHFTDWQDGKGMVGGISSVEWAQREDAQTDFWGGNFSWPRALRENDVESLSHVMHLLHDASAPAHVRNDAHPGLTAPSVETGGIRSAGAEIERLKGSHADSYEFWAKQSNDIFSQLRPDSTKVGTCNGSPCRTLEDIFQEMIQFTGRNFFSDNSIPYLVNGNFQSTYSSPNAEELRASLEDGRTYYYKTIEGYGEVPIARRGFILPFVLDKKVLEEQWKVLGSKAVEMGASLIQLYRASVNNTGGGTGNEGCTPHPETLCDRGDVYFEDGCGARELVEQCTSYQECIDASCVDQATCSDRCSYEGESECIDTDSWRECGYFESSCLSWSDSNQCGVDESCSSGECVEGPSCAPHASKICGEGEDVYWRNSCGDLEEIAERCSSGQVCENARCVNDVVGCQNECTNNSSACAGAASLKTCGNYDADSCTEWGPVNNCEAGEVCNVISSTEAECAGGSSSCNPIEGCSDSGCIFYDGFSGNLCRWNTYNVNASIANGNLNIQAPYSEGMVLVNSTLSTLSCQGDWIFEFKWKTSQVGLSMLISEGPKMRGGSFSCGLSDSVYVDINSQEWNTTKMQKDGNSVRVYNNSSLVATISSGCTFSNQDISIICSPSNNSGNCLLDYVKLICP